VSFSSISVLISVILVMTITTTSPAAVAAASFITGNGPNSFLPDLFQKAFVPKHDLSHIQEALIHTRLDIHLDIAAIPPTTSTTQKTATTTRIAIRNLVLELNRMVPPQQLQRKDSPIVASPVVVASSSDVVQVVGYTTASRRSRPVVAAVVDQVSSAAKGITKHPFHMPGFNGPHPMSSSGIGPIQIHEAGHYITLDTGMQYLPIDTSVAVGAANHQWELIWKEQSPAGVLVCGIELQDNVIRNQAMIPKGIMYLSFPVWNADRLQEYQLKKQECDLASKLHIQERDAELLKMSQTNNVLAKMIHYRNAFAAVEQYSLQPRKMLSSVPSDMEVITIGHNDDNSAAVLLSRMGTVRIVPGSEKGHANNNYYSNILNYNDQHVVRGTATIRPPCVPTP
jgi:hypothetical protein